MGNSNPSATATPEQVNAANATIDLNKIIKKFTLQSEATEKSNKRLTWFIVVLSVIQTCASLFTLFIN